HPVEGRPDRLDLEIVEMPVDRAPLLRAPVDLLFGLARDGIDREGTFEGVDGAGCVIGLAQGRSCLHREPRRRPQRHRQARLQVDETGTPVKKNCSRLTPLTLKDVASPLWTRFRFE